MSELDENKFSAPFRAMAHRIERNEFEEFAGAILIVPPDGKPIEVMVADPSKDAESFWAVAISKVQIAEAEYRSNKTNSGQGFRR